MYAFDAFVHVDLHTMWRYFQQFAKILKPGGRGYVSTANLMTEVGFERFSRQSEVGFGVGLDPRRAPRAFRRRPRSGFIS